MEDLGRIEEWLRSLSTEQLRDYRQGLEEQKAEARRRPRQTTLTVEHCDTRLQLIQRVLGQRGVSDGA